MNPPLNKDKRRRRGTVENGHSYRRRGHEFGDDDAGVRWNSRNDGLDLTSSGQRFPPQGNAFYPFPKLNFPVFNGDNAKNWVRKVEKFFRLCGIDGSQMVEMAGIHMKGKAENWFYGFLETHALVDWEILKDAILTRFGYKMRYGLVEDFNKLKQLGSMEEYIEVFEEMKYNMLQLNAFLSESYFISSFISGLTDELQAMVKMLNPST